MQSTREDLIAEYLRVRATTERLAQPLSPEDQCVQSMTECSPTKWHRAHTTWFFETFLLVPQGVSPVDARYGYLFNSYYEALGPRHPRSQRGLLSRPSAQEIAAYRRAVDGRMVSLLEAASPAQLADLAPLVSLGLAHEQQHQELLLTDALHALSHNPLKPAYRAARHERDSPHPDGSMPLSFVAFDGGVRRLGAPEHGGFCFDNERPCHRVFLEPFAVANRLVTVGEWKAFARAGGYHEPGLWLAEGLACLEASGQRGPLYSAWDEHEGTLTVFGLHGPRLASDAEPITHVSYYEADAIARFMGARLPSEAEWEAAAGEQPVAGNWLDSGALRALPCGTASKNRGPLQLFGDAWEWTLSSYGPYPGYEPGAGAVGEYNGKFMVNQQVLRGGSCFTPAGHVRPTYRNFWPAPTRFQVTGIRLARSL